jgi:hypothetical protein
MKNVLRLFKFLQLNQQAITADIDIQGIVRLHLVEILAAEIGVGKGRGAQG